MERNDRDVLLAVVSGVAVGLLALSFPSPIAFLGLIPGIVAVLDLVRRGQLTSVGVLLVAAALTAGLPSGWRLFGAVRAAGTPLPEGTPAVFGVACGALILGVMVLLLEPDEPPALQPGPAAVVDSDEPRPPETPGGA